MDILPEEMQVDYMDEAQPSSGNPDVVKSQVKSHHPKKGKKKKTRPERFCPICHKKNRFCITTYQVSKLMVIFTILILTFPF